ncbi:c-type cytochrome [Pseudoduganella sp. FT55W]|uniref:C-type cytochrome n=1 Tax=Duganella rivi TaxID=2666083 RepID=A0A7X4KCF9_9BURK|nr:cytochrome c [Duganella rivi]MYM67313.1 c-type cytochrome [Duganella rivi]
MRLRILIAALAAFSGAAHSADLLSQQCVACHAITKPSSTSLERLWDRKGPDLYYAGNKFNKPWLVNWLQNPTTIRAAGVMYAKAVKPSADKSADVVDAAQLPAHPKLSAADAATAADLLMALKVDGLVTAGAFKGEPGGSMAPMLFSKLRGCTSCHAAKPGDKPTSAPEMYSAGDRLQPDFVHAYVTNPQKFDPHTWMPTLGLNEADLQKLTAYISTLREKK